MIATARRLPSLAAAGLGAGTLAALSPLLAAAAAAGTAAVTALLCLPAEGLAAVLSGASFLSGLALEVGPVSVRPEQAAGLAIGIALLPRRGLASLPRVTLLAALWLAVGLLSALVFPEPGRGLVHTARLLATTVPLFALPAALSTPKRAERAWDLFLLFCVVEGLVGVGALAAHLALGTTWGMTIEPRLGIVHPHGTLLEPNLLGALSAAGGLALLLRSAQGTIPVRSRHLALAGALICLGALFASVTRAAWMALPAAALLLLLVAPRRPSAKGERRTRLRLAVAASIGIALAGTVAVVARSDGRLDAASSRMGISGRLRALANPSEDPNIVVRFRTYAAALALFRQSPLAGMGHGAMERIPGSEDRTLRWAGNLEVHLLADTGLAGLCLVLGLLFAIAFRTLGAVRSAPSSEERGRALERLGVLIVVVFCAQATETTWLASFWVVLGLLLSAAPRGARSKPGPLRVLFVHPSDELYGSDRVLLELVRRLDRSRIEPRVLLSTDVTYEGRLTARLRDEGVPTARMRIGVLRRRILASPALFVRFLWDLLCSTIRIALLIRSEKIDIVHANTVTVLPAAFGASLAGRPLVWHIHEIIDERPGRQVLLLLIRLLADWRVAVSDAVCAALGPAGNGRSVSVVKNTVPDRGPLPIPEGQSTVVYVGRISAWKGPEIVVEAAALLRQRHPNARFVLAGDEFGGGAELLTKLRVLAGERGVADRVEFRPFADDVTALYREASVVVCPSVLPEPFGLVVLEAMTAGRAVVASDHGGPRELVVDGETGLLVPPGDASALAAALGALLDDPGRAAAMGRAARERALSSFPIERAVASFEAIYESVAGRPPRPYATDISAA